MALIFACCSVRGGGGGQESPRYKGAPPVRPPQIAPPPEHQATYGAPPAYQFPPPTHGGGRFDQPAAVPSTLGPSDYNHPYQQSPMAGYAATPPQPHNYSAPPAQEQSAPMMYAQPAPSNSPRYQSYSVPSGAPAPSFQYGRPPPSMGPQATDKCMKCGAPFSADSSFCHKCGHTRDEAFSADSSTYTPTPTPAYSAYNAAPAPKTFDFPAYAAPPQTRGVAPSTQPLNGSYAAPAMSQSGHPRGVAGVRANSPRATQQGGAPPRPAAFPSREGSLQSSPAGWPSSSNVPQTAGQPDPIFPRTNTFPSQPPDGRYVSQGRY